MSYPVAPPRVMVLGALSGSFSWAAYLAARRLSRSTQHASAAVMTWSLLIFAYPVISAGSVAAGLRIPDAAFGASYLGVTAALTVLVLKSRTIAEPLSALLGTVTAVVLAASVLGSIAPRYVQPLPFRAFPGRPASRPVSDPPARSPNIYHLLLDGFGRADVLASQYGVDLSREVSALEALGYRVEADATSNYAQTYLSIASMLNLDYIHVPPANALDHTKRPMHEAIQANAVFDELRHNGYDIRFLASDYSASFESRQATACWCPPTLFGEFEASVVYRTPIRSWLPGSLDYLPHLNRVEGVLQRFAAPASSRGGAPCYTFGHILGPHPPFILDADGRFSPPRRAFTFLDGSMYPGPHQEYRAGYAKQARFFMRQVVSIAARLRAQDAEAIVIISGDHGPRLGFHADDARRTNAREVLPIFLAVRWGSLDPQARPHVSSPVNLYREILSRYFHTAMAPLPDRSYVSSFRTPYEFFEIDRRTLVP